MASCRAVGCSRLSRGSGAGNVWADFGEDQMMNPDPDLWVDFRPSGDVAGPGSPGNGSGSKIIAGCAQSAPEIKSEAHSWAPFHLLAGGRQITIQKIPYVTQ